MNEECIDCEVKLTDENCTQGAMFCDDCESHIREREIECEESECWFCQGSGKDELDEMGVCKPCHGKGFE